MAYPETVPIAALAAPAERRAPPCDRDATSTVTTSAEPEVPPSVESEDVNPFLPARSLARSPEAAPEVIVTEREETVTDPDGIGMTITESAEVTVAQSAMAVEEVALGAVQSPCQKGVSAAVSAVIMDNFIPAGRMLSRTPPAKVIEGAAVSTSVVPTKNAEQADIIVVDAVETVESEFKKVDLALPIPAKSARASHSPVVQRAVETSTSPLPVTEAETRDEACNTSIFVSRTPAKAVVQDTELLSKYQALQEATEQLEDLLENRNRYCESLEDDYEEAQNFILDFECRIAEDAMKLSVLEAKLREQKVLNTFDKIRCLDAETQAEEAEQIIIRLLGEKDELQALALKEKPAVALVIAPEESIGPDLSQHRMSVSSPIHPAADESKLNSPEASFVMNNNDGAVDDIDFGFDDNNELDASATTHDIDSPLTSARVRCDSYTTSAPVTIKKSPKRTRRRSSKANESFSSESNPPSEGSYHFDERCPEGYRIKGMRFIPLEAPKLHYAPIEVDLSVHKKDLPQCAERGRKRKSKQSRVPKRAPPPVDEDTSVDVAVEEEPAAEAEVESPAKVSDVKEKIKAIDEPFMRVVPFESNKKRKRGDSTHRKPAPVEREVISLVNKPNVVPAEKQTHTQLMELSGYAKFCAVTGPELSVLKAGITQDAMNELLVEMWDVSTAEEKQQWEDYKIVQSVGKKQRAELVSTPVKSAKEVVVVKLPVDTVGEVVEGKEAKPASKKGKGKKNKKEAVSVKKDETAPVPEPPVSRGRKRKKTEDVNVPENPTPGKADVEELPALSAKSKVSTPAAKAPKRRRSARKSASQEKENEENAVPVVPVQQSQPPELSIANVQKASLETVAPFEGMSPIAATPSDAKERRLLRSASKAAGRRLSTVSMASSVAESFHHNQMKSNTSTTSSAAGRRIVIPKLKMKIKK